MKKVLSFVLVLAMILGSVSLAFATDFSDTKDTEYAEAANLLTDLGVISGYADGTFKPGNSITRAEFAAMMVRALGFNVAGTSAVTKFSDVPAEYWASTYIKYASELGIIYGYNDGTFRPKNNITNDEAIAMLVRALGYQAQYMAGTFPTSHINIALGLGILDGIPTGSAAATRGTVAQLVFNAIDEAVITYDSTGNVVQGNPLITRLGAQEYNGGAGAGKAFVLDGTEDVASGYNFKEYIGAYVKAYANADDELISVKVLSEFVDSKINFASGNFNTVAAGDKVGSNATRANATTGAAASFKTFVNGDVTATPAYSTATVYKLAVAMDGNYVKRIYSIAEWVPTADAWVSADDLETIADDQSLLGVDFALTNKDEIDTSSFALLGVDKLSDIKKDNVVAVYAAGGKIVRVEVGTTTVEGTVSKISASGVYTIGGKTYDVSKLGWATTAAAAGESGTFYLDYSGDLYAFDPTTSASYYGIVLASANGATGLNGYTAKVRLFTEEGKKATYVVNDDATILTNRAFTTALTAGTVVTYTLNSNGEVKSLTPVTMTAGPAVKITKSGTIDGHVLNDASVLFAYDGTNYSVVTKANVLEKNTTGFTYNTNASNVVKVAVLNGVAGTTQTYYAYNTWAAIDNDSYTYELTFVDDAGKTVTFFSNTNAYTTGQAEVYTLSVNADNGIASATTTAAAAFTISAGNSTTCKKQGDVYVFSDGVATNARTLSEDVLVLVRQSNGQWAVKGTAALKGLTSADVVSGFDIPTADGVFDIVFVVDN